MIAISTATITIPPIPPVAIESSEVVPSAGDARSSSTARIPATPASTAPSEAREWCTLEEEVGVGSARHEILRIAAERQADLIVMGARRQGVLVRTVMGSTSQDVVRAASCPVLTVRAEAEPGELALAQPDASIGSRA